MKSGGQKTGYWWIVIWAIASIVFAFVLHCLFSIDAKEPFWQAKWGAGDILTYTSSIILGLLALWQNQRFKTENDEAQTRLEKLSVRANELQITSKMIEHENERISMLREAFQNFYDACSCSSIVSDFRPLSKPDETYSTNSALKANHIRTSFQVLFQQLNLDTDNGSLANEVVKNAKLLLVSATKLILSFKIDKGRTLDEKQKEEYRQTVKMQLQLEETLCKQFYTYLTELEKERNSLIFENYTLDELQAIYRQKELYQEKAQK